MLYKLTTPLSLKDIAPLRCGDEVFLSGTIITARDKAHEYLVRRALNVACAVGTQPATTARRNQSDEDELPFNLDGACLYHCGPIVAMTAKILAAGPTTSARMEAYTAEIIRQYGVRMIIGKGGMDERTRKALRHRAVYCSAVGGASQVLARAVTRVENVYGLAEFGETDAFWILRVKNFPAIVTMDSRGESLHENVKKVSMRKLKELRSL